MAAASPRDGGGNAKGAAKKGVPEWLNSSLWSSSATASHPTDRSPRSPRPPPEPQTTTRAPITDPPPAQRKPESPPRPPILQPPPPARLLSPPAEAPRLASGIPDSSRLSEEEVSRHSQLLAELSKKILDIGELRRLASQGIPDGAGIRSTVWKLLLGYLPKNREFWPHEFDRKRTQYKDFKEEFLMNPSEIARRMEDSTGHKNEELGNEDRGLLMRSEIVHDEHPLSLGKSSVWNQFFQDTEIIEQIDRDVKRTHPDMHFFSGDSYFAKSNQEALRNILIIFAKLNPGIRYVQGMNEILAPLFYVFKNDPDKKNAEFAEADAFFCFVELLSGFRDNFCQKLDNSVVGIRSTITRLSELLKKNDEELWRHLEITTKVNPQFYAFRWITLLLTQEFNFADSLHIWDTLLSDPEGPQETLLRICCAMLILVRRRLLAGDFTSNLKLLQNYPSTNISHLLYVANKLRGSSAG